jgi:hypothetical protein
MHSTVYHSTLTPPSAFFVYLTIKKSWESKVSTAIAAAKSSQASKQSKSSRKSQNTEGKEKKSWNRNLRLIEICSEHQKNPLVIINLSTLSYYFKLCNKDLLCGYQLNKVKLMKIAGNLQIS